jgi:hypothetical protein
MNYLEKIGINKFLKFILIFFINKINLFFLTKKIVFYHVPRSSGTSIKFFFRKYCGWDSFIENNSFKTPNKVLEERNNYRKQYILLGHMLYSDLIKNQNDIFQFTILRNPINRYLSEYYYNLNFNATKKTKKSNNIIQKKKLNLLEYAELVKNKNYDNILTRMFSYTAITRMTYTHSKSKINSNPFETEDYNFDKNLIVTDDDFKVAIYNLKNINIYILETLNRKHLYKKLNFKIFFDDFWENKSNRLNIISEEELKKIKSICEFDLKIYEYFLNSNFVNKY